MARLPDSIGKYDVVDRIGKGGMGMVYKAKHPTLDRFVILKKLNVSGDPVVRERFRREAEIMIDFRTDYVVDVYDHFRHGSADFIALEYIDGVSLDEILARERYLRNDVALAIIRDCCRGLDYVHGKGVVHRDVKPGNVIVGRDGSVKLLDFGIASHSAAFEDDLTSDGMTLGTVAYIAPEQIEHSRSVDRRADIYSTGAMLYEMVTGRKAFAGGFTPETVNRIQKGRYRRPRRVNPQVSRLASRIIRTCMSRRPERRYSSAHQIVSRIDTYFRRHGEDDVRQRIALLAGGESAAAAADGRGRKRHRLRRLVIAAGILVLVALAASYATCYFQRFFLSDSYALVQYQLRLRKDERAETGIMDPRGAGDHYVRLGLQKETRSEPETVNLLLPLLHPVASLETPDYVVLRSRLFTVPAGPYRSTVRLNQSVTQEERLVRPLALAWDVQRLEANWDPDPVSAVVLAVHAVDATSGDPVTGALVMVRTDGIWTRLPGSPGGAGRTAAVAPRIRPGDTVQIRVTHPAYDPVTTQLVLERNVRSARVNVEMKPR